MTSGNAESATRPREAERPQRDLFEELLRLRDKQREQRERAIWLLKSRDLPWELNRHGKMQWYMHPSMEQVSLRTLLFYRQDIPPGSRSGRQLCQGGIIFYIEEGRGYTLLEGVRHPWKAGDVVNLPIRTEGIVYQHFNADPDQRALLVGCEMNMLDALGVDKGSGFEELENCPEYDTEEAG